MGALLFFLGLGLLVAGAEALVRGASGLAGALRVSPIVVGLLVVGYGTSAPELGVSVGASLAGQPDVALGNVVGSNIFNVLFILGLSALIAPLTVSSRLVRLDVPIMVGISLLLLLMALDGQLGRLDGLALIAGLVVYTGFTMAKGREEAKANFDTGQGWLRIIGNCLYIAIGLAALVLGARWFVEGAVNLADLLGISPLVVSLLVVAAGTSLPEMVTSVVATIRGNRDIAVGNVVGSNIFNMLGVQGAASLAGAVSVPLEALRLDLPIMVATAIACLPVFVTGYRIARWEGALFLGLFTAYTAYLMLTALRPDLAPAYLTAMVLLVAPIVVVTLAVVAYREWRARRST